MTSHLHNDEYFMMRCLQLAAHGEPYVGSNPMVGAVLVHDGRIIGEGYHRKYGEAHAEVNCINSVRAADVPLIPMATLYVSLEPCAHHGKTPPCADLLIRCGIQKVVIGSRDPFESVNGSGIEKLRNAGIDVYCGVLEQECRYLNRRFFFFHEHKQPYLLLKWAQTANGFIGNKNDQRLYITNALVNRMVHQLRAAYMAILVGANTIILDDPLLNNRLYLGSSPIVFVIDPQLRIPTTKKVFEVAHRIVVFNAKKEGSDGNIEYVRIQSTAAVAVDEYCVKHNIISVMIEGGSYTLNAFMQERWNEAVRITNNNLTVADGVVAPTLTEAYSGDRFELGDNEVAYFYASERLVQTALSEH